MLLFAGSLAIGIALGLFEKFVVRPMLRRYRMERLENDIYTYELARLASLGKGLTPVK